MALPLSATPGSAPTDAVAQAIAWTEIRAQAAAEVPRITLHLNKSGQIVSDRSALRYASFAFFMSELRDEAGKPIRVDTHHEEWCDLMQHEALLVILAPRNHGKSWSVVVYFLWRAWRHNRDPETGMLLDGMPEGRLQLVLFGDSLDRAEERFEELSRIGNNEHNAWLLDDVFPRRTSKRRAEFRNMVTILARSYRTSTRGLHPDVIACDDVLNDTNTLTKYQRDKVWRYFTSVLLPMGASQYIVVGTAFHQDDLLHRLRPNPKKPIVLTIGRRRAQFTWRRYRAANFDTGAVLWGWKHTLVELQGLHDWDPLLYAREYDNRPIDDSASFFPYSLTSKALSRGEHETLIKLPWDIESLIEAKADTRIAFLPVYRRAPDELVILGEDLAPGAESTSDYTVCKVAAYNVVSGQCRLLWSYRRQGLTIDGQILILRMACAAFGVDLGVVESNNFQRWLHAATLRYSETAGRLVPHNTGQEKPDLRTGVPSVRLALEHDLWTIPVGDAESVEAAHIWQAEMQAYGWKDGKLMGVGEHDDEVMAWWFLDRARKLVEEWVRKAREEGPDEVTGEDVGIDPVRIGRPD